MTLSNKPLEELQALRDEQASALAETEAAIAAKAVDPLLVEARNVVGDYAARTKGYEVYEAPYRQGKRDSDSEVIIALAALKRGMELQRLAPAEPVDEAVMETHINAAISDIFIGSIRNQSKPNDEWLRDILARLINNATLARDSRWPAGNWLEGEAVDIANETGQPYTAALEMARRLRTYKTGAAS